MTVSWEKFVKIVKKSSDSERGKKKPGVIGVVNFQPPFFNFKLHIFMCTLREQKTYCSSVAQSCPTLCNPMDCSTPGLPSITISQSLLKLMSIASVMPSNHLILCRPLLLLPSIFPSIRVFVPCLLPVAKQKTNHLSTNDTISC